MPRVGLLLVGSNSQMELRRRSSTPPDAASQVPKLCEPSEIRSAPRETRGDRGFESISLQAASLRTIGPSAADWVTGGCGSRSRFSAASQPRPAAFGGASSGFDDREGQVYPAPSQAGPGNDIHAGSPGLQKAPTRGPASLVAIRALMGFSIERQGHVRVRWYHECRVRGFCDIA